MSTREKSNPDHFINVRDGMKGIVAILKYLSSGGDCMPHTQNEIVRALNESLKGQLRSEDYADSHREEFESALSSTFEVKNKQAYRHGNDDFVEALLEIAGEMGLVSAIKEEAGITKIGSGSGYHGSRRDKGRTIFKITASGLDYVKSAEISEWYKRQKQW